MVVQRPLQRQQQLLQKQQQLVEALSPQLRQSLLAQMHLKLLQLQKVQQQVRLQLKLDLPEQQKV